MTYTETKKFYKALKMAGIFIVIGIAMFALRYWLAPMANKSIESADELTRLDQQVASAKNQLNQLQYSIDASGKAFVDLNSNRDAYIRAIGLLCDANKLNIHKMTVDDPVVEEDNHISMLPVKLELQGDMYHIKGFISDLYASEMLCRISSISYRMSNESFSWMWRAIDDQNVVNWWDINNVSGYLTVDPDDTDSGDEMDLLDSSVFMKHGEALCYLEVQFIGTEG